MRNLCIGALIEAVRDQTKTVDLRQVNAVLLQPHWRHNQTAEPNGNKKRSDRGNLLEQCASILDEARRVKKKK
ncbi:MAG: hypothetical protein EAZ42_12245 [Verrucomicrobia bacterium]|nr:MAG: hypothetical protein EAZ42_12245 [Verrucomicrobiota bacterium]